MPSFAVYLTGSDVCSRGLKKLQRGKHFGDLNAVTRTVNRGNATSERERERERVTPSNFHPNKTERNLGISFG